MNIFAVSDALRRFDIPDILIETNQKIYNNRIFVIRDEEIIAQEKEQYSDISQSYHLLSFSIYYVNDFGYAHRRRSNTINAQQSIPVVSLR